MILRHATDPREARSCDDTFEAIDEHNGKTIASCYILIRENELLYPNRPIRILIELEGDPIPDALLGAAVARAKEIAREFSKPARVFTTVEPENEALLTSLSILGLKDNDGIIIMGKSLEEEPAVQRKAPVGCVLVEDTLDDELEQKFFLERYSGLYGEDFDYEWLMSYIAQEDFHRYILIASNGMAGEVVSWKSDGVGKIGWFNVPVRWRDMGIASTLIGLTCDRFKKMGLTEVECEIQARVPGVLRMLEKNNFKQKRLIMRYPGVDVDACSK